MHYFTRTLAVALVLAGCTTASPHGVDAGPSGTPADGVLSPGTAVVEGSLGLTEPEWAVAPFLHEVPTECPLPAGIFFLPSPHHEWTAQATEAVSLSLTLERFDLTGDEADTGLVVYAGAELPTTETAALACQGVAAASGFFPAEIRDVPIDAGASVTVAIWDSAGFRPTQYRLTYEVVPR